MVSQSFFNTTCSSYPSDISCEACVVVSNNKGLDKKMHISGMTVEAAHGFLPLPPGLPIGVGKLFLCHYSCKFRVDHNYNLYLILR
jgi:hypothetical protein